MAELIVVTLKGHSLCTVSFLWDDLREFHKYERYTGLEYVFMKLEQNMEESAFRVCSKFVARPHLLPPNQNTLSSKL